MSVLLDMVLCGFTRSAEPIRGFANPAEIRSRPKGRPGSHPDLLYAKSLHRLLGYETAEFLSLKRTKHCRSYPFVVLFLLRLWVLQSLLYRKD